MTTEPPLEKSCVHCGETEGEARLEHCVVCHRLFCTDCAHRLMGRRFCSEACSRAFLYGDEDDDENNALDE